MFPKIHKPSRSLIVAFSEPKYLKKPYQQLPNIVKCRLHVCCASLLITASLHAAHLNTNQTPHMSPWLVAILTAWCREPPLHVIFAGSQEPAFVMFPVHCLFCCCSSPRLPLGDTCRQRRWRPRTLDTHTRPRQDTLFVSGVIWITRKNIRRIAKK